MCPYGYFRNRNNYLKNNNTDGPHLRNLRTESLANIIGLTSLWMAAHTLCQLLAKYSKQMLDNFRPIVSVKHKMCFDTNSSHRWESIQARFLDFDSKKLVRVLLAKTRFATTNEKKFPLKLHSWWTNLISQRGRKLKENPSISRYVALGRSRGKLAGNVRKNWTTDNIIHDWTKAKTPTFRLLCLYRQWLGKTC